MEHRSRRLVGLEAAVAKLELDVRQVRTHKRAALEAANGEIRALREKQLEGVKKLAAHAEALAQLDAKHEQREALLADELEGLREPVMTEVANLRRENRGLVREIERTRVAHRHLLGDCKKLWEEEGGSQLTFLG